MSEDRNISIEDKIMNGIESGKRFSISDLSEIQDYLNNEQEAYLALKRKLYDTNKEFQRLKKTRDFEIQEEGRLLKRTYIAFPVKDLGELSCIHAQYCIGEHRTYNDEERCFSGTNNSSVCELYSAEEFSEYCAANKYSMKIIDFLDLSSKGEFCKSKLGLVDFYLVDAKDTERLVFLPF